MQFPVSGEECMLLSKIQQRFCFNWPAEDFHKYAKLEIIDEGKNAIDFELLSVNNRTVKLSDLLKERHVVLQTGSWTCTMFQKNIEETNALQRKYGKHVAFVVIYSIEAHPKGEVR